MNEHTQPIVIALDSNSDGWMVRLGIWRILVTRESDTKHKLSAWRGATHLSEWTVENIDSETAIASACLYLQQLRSVSSALAEAMGEVAEDDYARA